MTSDRLTRFAEDVGAAILQVADVAAITAVVKGLLSKVLLDAEFVLDCADRATAAMASSVPSLSWDNPPIVDNDALAFSIRLIYWPARSRNTPHRHTCWTVTGVLSNELTFVTYAEPAHGAAPATIEHEFHGRAGDMGAILPPCIHQVVNSSPVPSVSVHVFSGPKTGRHRDRGAYERGHTTWFTGADNEDGPTRLENPAVIPAIITLLDTCSGPRVVPIVERLFSMADPASKLACIKVLAKHDTRLAGERLSELADRCDGEDRVRLRAIAGVLTLI